MTGYIHFIPPLITATEMKLEHKKALAKGLPFPILTIAEYLSQDGEGFCWGRRYRLSGYYASILLWGAFCSWLLMNVLLCAVPRYGVYCMQLTGMLMLSTNALYAILLPKKPLVIPFENEVLSFHYGWSFWVVFIGGSLAVVVGAIISIIDTLFPHKFSTILEIDYDTPYRYFVGNDAHLFGHLNGGKCPHATASATSSTATESTTCCGGHVVKKKPVRKLKSDASTSTVMSIPINKGFGELISDATVSSSSSNVLKTRAKIENNNHHHHHHLLPHHHHHGFLNDAFEGEDNASCSVGDQADNDDYHDCLRGRSPSSSIEQEEERMGDQVHPHHNHLQLHTHQEGSSNRKISTGSKKGHMKHDKKSEEKKSEDEGETSDASDVSTTIIDGKRAISLHNFGKFTAQQLLLQQQHHHPKQKDTSNSSSNHHQNTQSQTTTANTSHHEISSHPSSSSSSNNRLSLS